MFNRRRLAAAAASDPLRAFWWEHGHEWGQDQAAEADLARIGELARRVERLDDGRAAAEVVAEFKKVWSTGAAQSADAFGWDEMNDQLPPSAMLAFVRGAGQAWEAKRAEA